MQRFLITGFSGFVSHHFLLHLEQLQIPVVVLGVDLTDPEYDYKNFRFVECSFRKTDLLNKEEIKNILKPFQPDFIVHLASFSSVAFSWKNPIDSFANNTNIFLNLLEGVRMFFPTSRVLSIGSSEEYGNVKEDDIPIVETQILNPVSPYAVARVAQEMITKVYVDGYGLDIVLTRSFNHIGPGQKDIFVIPSFARQLVDIKRGLRPNELLTGDLTIIRDFVDVRDVVSAYYTLLQKGKKGEVYNICSGRGISLKEIIFIMEEFLNLKVKTKTDKTLVRLNDNRVIIGSNEKIRKELGWSIKYSLEESLKDVIHYWESK